jgi:hypothetical protein
MFNKTKLSNNERGQVDTNVEANILSHQIGRVLEIDVDVDVEVDGL